MMECRYIATPMEQNTQVDENQPVLENQCKKRKKKYEDSVKSGASADEVYHPKLWYYDLFVFLGNQETSRNSTSNLNADEETLSEVESVQENVDSKCPSQAQPTTDGTESLTQNEKVACSSKSGTVTTSRSRPGKNNYDSLIKDVLTTVQEHSKRPRTEEDCFAVFGKSVAMKLREVDKRQSLIAEKIINDVIFEAELGGLTLQHRCVNMQEMYNARNPNMQQCQPLILPCQSASNSTSYSSSPSFISTPATNPNCQFQQNNCQFQQTNNNCLLMM
ncbi:uncharacterized protein LOC126737550 [Anthonomus grandis grandis]|uniref:uncharacterized protein LOC126737550 n=1 Tax=Anthonomus grandis grandis TaxID=2921223 RepID=UPI002165936C|nr:uncharacterized protein LOC126737550 [Anthonomus grandis grandis]